MDEEARLELVRDWLTRARRDLEAARALAALSEPLLDSAIYHCQQAAEKALKGWLQMQDDPFPKTHDIERLVRQAALQEPEFNQHLQAAAVLTPYASAFRYPGGAFEPMPSREEFDEALGHAQVIFDFVVARVPREAKP
ncbi:MAG: HEPN domain-containing protein [Verrucomicrobiales bacterium]|nr:HEPN domain-containing protein [Verrucomicrobiales bacterium]